MPRSFHPFVAPSHSRQRLSWTPLYIDVNSIDSDTLLWALVTQRGQNSFVMDKNSRNPVHCWLVLGKAFQAASKYLYAGLEETGIDDTDFRILEALLNKG